MRGNKITTEDKTEMLRLRVAQGLTYKKIGDRYKVNHATVIYHVKRLIKTQNLPLAGIKKIVTVEVKTPKNQKSFRVYEEYLQEWLDKRKRNIKADKYLRYYY